jgi:hypothetical protein
MAAKATKKDAPAMWCSTRTKACIALVAAGLIAAVVMMTRGTTLQNGGASSSVMKYISTMGSGNKGKHAATGTLDYDYDNMDVGQHRKQRMEAYLSERAKCDDRSSQQSSGWVSVDMDANNITYNSEWVHHGKDVRPYHTRWPHPGLPSNTCTPRAHESRWNTALV